MSDNIHGPIDDFGAIVDNYIGSVDHVHTVEYEFVNGAWIVHHRVDLDELIDWVDISHLCKPVYNGPDDVSG